jgi:Ca2+-binding RTX toxin-like protein
VQETAGNAAQQPGVPHPDLGRSVDKVIASISYTLTAFVENLSLAPAAGNLSASGNELNNVITGNEGNNVLSGDAGDDTLDGGLGADSMSGGTGADTYYVDNAGDVVTETANEINPNGQLIRDPDLGRAVDKVVASISYTLGGFVENLSLAAAAGNLAGSGNELNNELYGNEGKNTLNGKAGNDTIDGGTGTDTAQYSGKLSDYTLGLGVASTTVSDKRTSGSDGVDSLSNVERLQFSDVRLALDLGTTQAGGKAVLAMAATLGAAFPTQKDWAGAFLNYFDTGASMLDGTTLLVSAGVMASFAGGADNASLVKWVYTNVNGQAPDAATLASLVAPLNAGSISQSQWMADMALSTANQNHVNLAGYAGSGLQYL